MMMMAARIRNIFLISISVLCSENAWALNEATQTFTLDGKLYQSGTTSPLLDSAAKITVQIIDPSGKCVLYEEEQTVNTQSSDGYFHINVGSNTGASKRTVSDPGRTMAQIFQNISAISANNVSGQTCPGSSYTPSAGASRNFRITVTPSVTNIPDTLTPDVVIDSVPQALVAQSVQGLEKSSILQVNNSGSTVLTQANLEALFTTPAYTNLQSILAGNFIKTDTSGAGLPSYAADPAGASNGDIWFDSTTGQVKYQNSGGVQVVGGGSGGISSLTVGSSMSINGTVAGTISGGSAGTIDLTNTGVGAGTYSKVTVDTKGRVTAGTVSLVEADIPNLTVAGKVSGDTITSGTISGSAGINTSGNLITTGTVSGLNVQATNVRIYTGANYIQMTAPTLGGNVNLTLPVDDGNAGDVLSTDGSGVLSWVTSLTNSLASGKILVGNGSNVAAAVGLSGDATLSNAGVLTLANTGVGAGTYSKVTVDTKGRVTSAANITSSDVTTALGYSPVNGGSFAANRLIASNITGTALMAYNCSLNQVISFDASGAYTCANVSSLIGAILNGGNTTGADISLGTDDNQALKFKVNNATAITISQSGSVGIGTPSPAVAMDVQGQIRSRTNDVTGSAVVDWNGGNIQYTADSCQGYTFNNLVDGASYTFVVKGATSAQCTFTSAGLSFHFTPANSATNANSHAVYTLFRAGSDVYVSWTTGL